MAMLFGRLVRGTTRSALSASAAAECRAFTSAAAAAPKAGGYMMTGDKRREGEEVRFLITGASGQIGLELAPYLRTRYGTDNVIASDVRAPPRSHLDNGPFIYADVMQPDQLARVVLENRITCIIHLASLLSASGERNPALAMKVNTRGIETILELARMNQLSVFAPSTIAAFGDSTPKVNTPNTTIQRPTTIYGVTKVYLELLGEYYHQKFGVDFRSIRYPGIISSESAPGGGTTDYAVDIYYEALRHKQYRCFLRPDSELPMMYMPDCLKATADLIEADPKKLSTRVYNVTAMSFTPAQLAAAIAKQVPGFTVSYEDADFRQKIASSWPRSIDDSVARNDWGWKPQYDIDTMTTHMLMRLKERGI
eukprot:TRINITY_DN1126_c0_g1::TRINITY_DN1126_c0_g1_i1::g.17377::m.17377 TRINITY_DN1126_c0_g1::TRINITY_DN1126_c0_g1_i1::g.17377  ORF type:complete len:383 (+),score=109.88,sp/Q2KIR8/TDH_BOVIN/51.78/1e-110,Epimerase/PF01370.16/4e-22,RmlD_sub_bind/PF04321.12/2.6e-11,NAD_binding_4/PF07993.7/1e+03,NAD_binding_4/PF07993.7/1e-08,3Beta_HSD/PF01073.14/1.1e-07,Polysacc_synt_2/PF02719.10/0.0011,adh_short/PF00106.20/7.2e+03,adh_short/PF00106.20/0.00037,Chorion_2/PF03964.10/0.23 TRINITY_DN1126_c0_g1_i1:51-1151(+)